MTFQIMCTSVKCLQYGGGNSELLQIGVGAEFMSDYGDDFLSFVHGAFHACLQGWLGFVLPLLG